MTFSDREVSSTKRQRFESPFFPLIKCSQRMATEVEGNTKKHVVSYDRITDRGPIYSGSHLDYH